MTTDPRPALGVLGGMGPAATADFLLRLAGLTPAARDQDHLPTIVYSDPQTPDRSDAILGHGPSPLPALRRGIDFLNRAGCPLIAIPCNSAHYWYEQLISDSAAPIVHIVDATADQLRARLGDGLDAVGVMATDGTIAAKIYQDRLGAAGITTLDLTDQQLPGQPGISPVMGGIRLMKAGQEAAAREQLSAAAAQLVDRGAQALVVGCTDISAVLAGVAELAGVPVLDAADCLAEACLGRMITRP